MKNEIQTLVNTLFWEKYVDSISEHNHKECVREFHKSLGVICPSVIFYIDTEKAMTLHAVVFVVKNIIIKL